MFSLPNIMRVLSSLSAALLALSLALAAPTTSPSPGPATIGKDRVVSCDEAAYPTPTPPPKPKPGVRSTLGPNRDTFAVAEALQMPISPSAFAANGKLLPNVVAPKLPPAPAGQFVPLATTTPNPHATTTPYASPTTVPTLAPATPRRVVIQAGHWQSSKMPYQLAEFRSDGAYDAGVAEWQVNLDVANRAANLLRVRGYDVRVVPATVPIGCQADAFIALHADGDASTTAHGYKAAYPHFINNPVNRRFLADLYIEYGAATGLSRDYAITRNMSGYYAFYARRQPYAVDARTPMLILEMGYLSNPNDRQFLATRADVAALGVANGIDRFLQGK